MSDKPDGFGNWCPDCGERKDLCQCEQNYTSPEYLCPKCKGTGLSYDGLEGCEHCNGMGYEWWWATEYDSLDDDGVYVDDEVIHQPYDDDED